MRSMILAADAAKERFVRVIRENAVAGCSRLRDVRTLDKGL